MVLKPSAELPALPPINDPATRAQVFTHRSYHMRPSRLFEDPPNDPSPDNESLEHFGDSILSFCVTSLIRELYPGLRPGAATLVRSQIVSNENLAAIATRYGLASHLLLHSSQAILLRETPGILADTFEAYIGGLFSDSSSLNKVQPWLTALLTPFVHEAYSFCLHEHESAAPAEFPEGCTAKLNQKLQQNGRIISWSDSNVDALSFGYPEGTILWEVVAVVDGVAVAQAVSTNKKVAKNIAAGRALQALGMYNTVPML